MHNGMRKPDLSPVNTCTVSASYDMTLSFNIPLCVQCTVLPSVMIITYICCTWTMFVARALVFMRWSLALVSAMLVPC